MGILPEDVKGKSVVADGWADGSLSWDWPVPSSVSFLSAVNCTQCILHKCWTRGVLFPKDPPGWTNRAQQREPKDTVNFLGSRQQGGIEKYSKESRELQKDHPGNGRFLNNK